ncbi:hypothetical protein [Croceicoccus sp. BE223]|nr:hypothetical protein [Croceicoccus sp. BE223]MDR7101531.1 hypothetical protein [Croceicoccus sp. BE223]
MMRVLHQGGRIIYRRVDGIRRPLLVESTPTFDSTAVKFDSTLWKWDMT